MCRRPSPPKKRGRPDFPTALPVALAPRPPQPAGITLLFHPAGPRNSFAFRAIFNGVLAGLYLVILVGFSMGAGWFWFQPRGVARSEKSADPAAALGAGLMAGAAVPEKSEKSTDARLEKRRPREDDDERRPKSVPDTSKSPPPTPAATDRVTFEKDVLPIFESKCVSCHGASKRRAGLDVRAL